MRTRLALRFICMTQIFYYFIDIVQLLRTNQRDLFIRPVHYCHSIFYVPGMSLLYVEIMMFSFTVNERYCYFFLFIDSLISFTTFSSFSPYNLYDLPDIFVTMYTVISLIVKSFHSTHKREHSYIKLKYLNPVKATGKLFA